MLSALVAIVRVNHMWTGYSLHTRPLIRSFDDYFLASFGKLLNKQSICRWFGTLLRWCYITVMSLAHIGVIGPHCINSSPPGQSGRNFRVHFHEWKVLYFDSNLTEVCSKGFNWQYISIGSLNWVSMGSGNGSSPVRRQAITWTNAYPVHWRMYAALGGDELDCGIATSWSFRFTTVFGPWWDLPVEWRQISGRPLFPSVDTEEDEPQKRIAKIATKLICKSCPNLPRDPIDIRDTITALWSPIFNILWII